MTETQCKEVLAIVIGASVARGAGKSQGGNDPDCWVFVEADLLAYVWSQYNQP